MDSGAGMHDSGSTVPAPSIGLPIPREDSPDEVVIIDPPQTNIPHSSRTTFRPCPGYKLDIPPHVSPYLAYPCGRHSVQTLPWKTLISNDEIRLIATLCTGTVNVSSASPSSAERTCPACASLRTHDAIIAIQNGIFNGTHENSHLAYQSHAQLSQIIRKKNEEINKLKLSALNAGRTLTRQADTIGNTKRLVMALSTYNIPRVHAVIRSARKNGAGIMGILDKINRAASGLYSPKSFEEAEFQQMMLFATMGGARVAAVAQRSCALPSARTAQRKLHVHPLRSSAAYPTANEMTANLTAAFLHTEFLDISGAEIAMTLCVDELKLEERLRWDPSSNMMLGVCREHSSELCLEFRSMAEAEMLLDALTHNDEARRVHFAVEVCF